jgi:hypothetical protein
MHPNFIAKTLQYQRTKGLRNNVQLWPLAVLPSSMLKLLTSTVVPNSVAHFGAGQSYANVTLNVYKRAGGLCLTSFELFGGGVCGFQQLPWCCNLNGVAIWTQVRTLAIGLHSSKLTSYATFVLAMKLQFGVLYSSAPALPLIFMYLFQN